MFDFFQVGFNPEDVIFDPNILTVGTGLAEHNNYGVEFFRSTRVLKHVCPGCKVSGGVSNIAFSFRGNEPVRRAFHSAFLHWGSLCGMDMGIVNAAQVGASPRWVHMHVEMHMAATLDFHNCCLDCLIWITECSKRGRETCPVRV